MIPTTLFPFVLVKKAKILNNKSIITTTTSIIHVTSDVLTTDTKMVDTFVLSAVQRLKTKLHNINCSNKYKSYLL